MCAQSAVPEKTRTGTRPQSRRDPNPRLDLAGGLREVAVVGASDDAPSAEQSHQEQHDRDDQEDVDEVAECVTADHAEQPQNEQNNRNCFQHGGASNPRPTICKAELPVPPKCNLGAMLCCSEGLAWRPDELSYG